MPSTLLGIDFVLRFFRQSMPSPQQHISVTEETFQPRRSIITRNSEWILRRILAASLASGSDGTCWTVMLLFSVPAASFAPTLEPFVMSFSVRKVAPNVRFLVLDAADIVVNGHAQLFETRCRLFNLHSLQTEN